MSDVAGDVKGVEGKKTSDLPKIVLALVFIVVFFVSYRYFSERNINQTEIYGIKVVSDKPLADYTNIFQTRGITLFDTKTKGGLTCNFEILATSTRNTVGYYLRMEEGDQGIYLYTKEGYLKGMSEKEMVSACNAFTCMANNITCPANIADLGKAFSNPDEINIILDVNAGQAGGRGYAELLGMIAYMQAEKADVNKDGVVSAFEIANVSGNFIAIRPYLMNGSVCKPQQLHNLIETYEPDGNISVRCQDLSNAIFIVNSTENKIIASEKNIYLLGDSDHLYSESVIVRDALSPKWVRVLYQIEK